MRLLPLFLVLCACGGRGGGYDPVTHVHLVESLPGGESGYARWDAHGSSIELLSWLMEWERVDTLKHELWHLLTLRSDHGNPDDCASSQSLFLFTETPCRVEVDQVVAAGRTVTLDFPDDPECAREAASFWNDAVGYDAVVVLEVP